MALRCVFASRRLARLPHWRRNATPDRRMDAVPQPRPDAVPRSRRAAFAACRETSRTRTRLDETYQARPMMGCVTKKETAPTGVSTTSRGLRPPNQEVRP